MGKKDFSLQVYSRGTGFQTTNKTSSNQSIKQSINRSSTKQNTKEEEMSNPATDPLNILGNPPSTFVKVHGTSRDDVNGLLGLAIQYNSERGRYMVQMALPSA